VSVVSVGRWQMEQAGLGNGGRVRGLVVHGWPRCPQHTQAVQHPVRGPSVVWNAHSCMCNTNGSKVLEPPIAPPHTQSWHVQHLIPACGAICCPEWLQVHSLQVHSLRCTLLQVHSLRCTPSPAPPQVHTPQHRQCRWRKMPPSDQCTHLS